MQKFPKMFKPSSIPMNTNYSISLLIAIGTISLPTITRAQTYQPSNRIPVADNSLGTQVFGANNNFTITGGLNRGQNLFHSFQDFSVPTGGATTFLNPVGNRSIITRVTGGNFSDINGLVNTQGANLFLINPNGIVFGTNAQLNVGQTFVGSTANGIDLVDSGGRSVNFGTNQSGDAQLLTINPNALFNVSGLNMGGGNGQISNFGTLQTANPNQYIGLIGGNVSLNGGNIVTLGGRVELGGLSAQGNVLLGVDGNNLRVQFPTNISRSDVLLTNQAGIYVPGAGGGDIAVNARNIQILSGSILNGGIFTGLGAPGTVAGDIRLNATGEVILASNSKILNYVNLNSTGKGGNITVDAAGSISLQDNVTLSAATVGTGDAGNVTLTAKDSISLTNAGIDSTVGRGGMGKSGNVNVTASSLSLTNGSQLQTVTLGELNPQLTTGRGDAGNINVKVTGAVDIAGTKNGFDSGIRSIIEPGAEGNAGNVSIKAGSFSLRDEATLAASTAGKGNAGSVTVNTTNAVSLVGSKIYSTVEAGGMGKGGNIDIQAGSLSLRDGVTISASSTGKGDAGNFNANVTGTFDIAGTKNGIASRIFIVNTGKEGNGGNISVNAGSLSLQDGAQLSTSISGQGNAGNVTVKATNDVSLTNNAGIFSTVEAGGVGKGGNIDIQAGSLSLTNGSQLQTATRSVSNPQIAPGRGDAGHVKLKVTGAIDIAGSKNGFASGLLSSVESRTQGNSGNITVDAGSFSLRDGARLSTSTLGTGKAGNVTVKATNDVSLTNNAGIFSTVEAGGVGNGGNIDIQAGSLLLRDGAQLASATSGTGKAGNVTVKATNDVSLTNNAGIFSTVEEDGVGNGGNIDIQAGSLSLRDGATLQTIIRGASATQLAGKGDAGNVNVKVTGSVDIAGIKNGFTSTIASLVDTGTIGKGGNITIEAGSFLLRDGALVTASTGGTGDAGTIEVNATDFVTISGKSGNLSSRLLVNSQSNTGIAGNIIVTAPKITLDNGATIEAGSVSGNGGNINIGSKSATILLLRRGTQISTSAEGTQKGNGGNITINIPNGFIVTAPNENSDISANGFSGSGGKVNIKTQQNFWISPLSRAEVEKRLGTTDPTRLNPARLNTNDITAISQVNPNLSGQVSITPPQIDITAGLSPLPNNVTDPTNQINPNCSAKAIANNSFTSVGRGGIPATPKDPLNEQEIATNWVRINPQDALPSAPIAATPASSQQIVEAQGWRRERNGDIILVAGSSLRTLPRQGQSPSGCVGQ
jgi:filamentous hemagglutinin family protein